MAAKKKIEKTRATPKPWVMPDWMEKYRPHFCNTGGNSVEELMNDHTTTVQINAPLAMLCVAVSSQVLMLERMHQEGMLK